MTEEKGVMHKMLWVTNDAQRAAAKIYISKKR